MNKINDTLYNTNSQQRERNAIFQFFNSPFIFALCNDWWNWFAVGIPMNLNGNDIDGDLDLIVSRPSKTPPQIGTKPMYRVFEVKTSIIEKEGKVRSLKLGKINELNGQLKKLKKFGCHQLFLFDIYVIQSGFSLINDSLPIKIKEAIFKKARETIDIKIGYVAGAIESSPFYDDNVGGILHPLINIISADKLDPVGPFLGLMEKLEHFYNDFKNNKENLKNMGIPIITYCYDCKKLTMLSLNQYCKYSCFYCSGDLS